MFWTVLLGLLAFVVLVLWYHGAFSGGDPKIETYKGFTYFYKEFQDSFTSVQAEYKKLFNITKSFNFQGFGTKEVFFKSNFLLQIFYLK